MLCLIVNYGEGGEYLAFFPTVASHVITAVCLYTVDTPGICLDFKSMASALIMNAKI